MKTLVFIDTTHGNKAKIEYFELLPYSGAKEKQPCYRVSCYNFCQNDFLYFVSCFNTLQGAKDKLTQLCFDIEKDLIKGD